MSVLTRPLLLAASALALAACEPQVPDSAAGIGDATSPFNPPPQVEAGQTINGDPLIPSTSVADTGSYGAGSVVSGGATQQSRAMRPRAIPAITGAGTTTSSADIANETAAALVASSGNSGRRPVEASPSNPAPQLIAGNPGISDENDFAAVSSRQTIESDAQRLARLRAQRQEVSPTALPQRQGSSGPNVVQYALTTSNPKGNRIYTRAGINLRARSVRACGQYPSPELAQQAFLEAGGPKRDKLVLDPDGDGYACGWDPRPLRAAVRAGG